MEKINKLLEALRNEAETTRKVTAYMRKEGVEELANKVREESTILNQLGVKENKEVRDKFYNLQVEFRKTLSKEQLDMYNDLEAYSNLLSLAGRNGSK